MQYNKGQGAGGGISVREETGTLACVTSFGLSLGRRRKKKEINVCVELEQVE